VTLSDGPDAEAPRILLVEDDEIMRLSLEDRLRMEGMPITTATDLAGARRALANGGLDLVVTDVRLPDGSGSMLFEEVCRQHPGTPVILITAYVSVPQAVALIKAGAVDYITKPFDIEAFVALVKRTLSSVSDAHQAELTGADGVRFRAGSGVLGRSPALRRIEEVVARLRGVDSSVLITGESGVGKEVVARLIHHNSRRAEGLFVAVNCAAIPIDLVESELFGHERGAFTGADRRRIGRFELAEGGTLFLDEVAEIPPEVQVKLLRVLQERRIERVGGTASIELDVRVLAATQVNLVEALAESRFRSDLYWRLNVIHIDVPPLRERSEDIVYLSRKFVTEHARVMEKEVAGLSAQAEARLLEMPFPGNVRELRNLLERAVALCAGPQVQEHDLFILEPEEKERSGVPPSLKAAVELTERAAIRSALTRSEGSISKAADALEISRKNLWEKMRRYGIRR
jgi:two-component system response regulator AtoC